MAEFVFKQVIATIDQRTTNICLHAAGQIQPVKDPFDTLNGQIQHPPFHVHCRSLVMTWMPGFGNEQRQAANAELQRRPKKQRDTRGARVAPRIPGL